MRLLLYPHDINLEARQRYYSFNTLNYYMTWVDERTVRPVNRSTSTYPTLIANSGFYMGGQSGDNNGSPAWLWASAYANYYGWDPLNYGNDYVPLVETSHLSSYWIVLYLRSGHPIFTEFAINQSVATSASQNGARDWTYGPSQNTYQSLAFATGSMQTRGIAWALRQYGFTDAMLPDTDRHRKWISDIMDTNAQFGTDIAANNYFTAQCRALGLQSEGGPGGTFFQPYMKDYLGLTCSVLAWHEAFTNTRPGFASYVQLLKPALIDLYDETQGGTGYISTDYKVFYTSDGNAAANDMSNAFSTLAAMRSHMLSIDNVTSLPAPGGFSYAQGCWNGNSFPPAAGHNVACCSNAYVVAQMGDLAMQATMGFPGAQTVYNQLRARTKDSSVGNSGPTYIYYDSNFAEYSVSMAHAVIIPGT